MKAMIVWALAGCLFSPRGLWAEEANSSEPERESRQALIFEPFNVCFDGTSDIGPLAYHVSLNDAWSASGHAKIVVDTPNTGGWTRWSAGLGFTYWMFSPRRFQGLFLSKRVMLGNDPTGPGVVATQDLETGYQWSFDRNLVAIRFRFYDLSMGQSVGLSLGRAW